MYSLKWTRVHIMYVCYGKHYAPTIYNVSLCLYCHVLEAINNMDTQNALNGSVFSPYHTEVFN
jgi:hypothetical protein